MTWTKLPALDGRPNPCLCCPSIVATPHHEREIAVGFGDAHVERDGEEIYREPGAYATLKRCANCAGIGRIGEWDGKDFRTLYALPECEVCHGAGDVDDPTKPEPEYWTVADAEKVASADPDHDWRIVLYGPLHGEVYQRQAEGEWVLIESNQGFA